MQQKVHNGNLKELHVCRRAPRISHLLFTDDTLIFMEANENHVETVKNIINVYEKGTCQVVNPAKCSMVFGALCPDSQQQKVRDVLQVTNLLGDERYLGLPTSEGHMGKGKFKSTKERLVKQLSSWAERCMSRGAKEVLIKFVAQAIPTYVMGAFKLPAKLCDEITRLIRRF
jgi:predicted metal-binding protein